jgi:indolepyruvate ferredoxin oxidoreductase
MPVTLDRLIAQRVALLTAYQNPAYARRYLAALERLRKVEAAVDPDGRLALTEAVARNLAKLMAYKDEYEVARLHSAPEFLAELRSQFEGEPGKDYQLHFHLAPTMTAARDAAGRLVKRRYGPWMMQAFSIIARFKGLRGTLLDPFGKTAERRRERELVDDYFALVRLFCETLTPEHLDTALELARLPEKIRGYGHVKEKAMDAAAERRARLMAVYGTSAHQNKT